MARFSCTTCRNKTCLKTGTPCPTVEKMLPCMDAGNRVGRKRIWTLGIYAPRVPRAHDPVLGHKSVSEKDLARRPDTIEMNRAALDNAGLTGKRRAAVEMYYWHGINQREIAARLHLSERTIGEYLHRFRVGCGVPPPNASYRGHKI